MFASFLDPPFCAHVARSSAALLPSCPEWPFTFTHRVITFLSITACTSRLHTAITVAFYVDLYMNYNEVHNHLHVDRFRFRAPNTPISTRPNANTYQ